MRVTEACGWTPTFMAPPFCNGSELLATTKRNLFESGGLMLPNASHSGFIPIDYSGDSGDGIMMGHMELQRGGWAKRMTNDVDKVAQSCWEYLHPNTPFLSREFQQERVNGSFLDQFMQHTAVTHPLEYLYWLNYKVRVNRWLIPQYIQYSRYRWPVYPLLDELVVRTIHGVSNADRTMETLVFRAIERMAPQLRDVPLFMSRFRFESTRCFEPLRAGYRERSPIEPSNQAGGFAPEFSLRGGLGAQICSYVSDSRLASTLKLACAEPIWQLVESFGANQLDQYCQSSNVPRRKIATFLWLLYNLAVVYSESNDAADPS